MLAWAPLALLTLVAVGDDAAPELPYKAVVRAARTQVRSGPGREHLVTQELSAGSEVEVHRVDPRGWLAIRPPAGSLSWVAAENASEVVDGVATVEGQGVASLIGSQLSDERGSFQVVLEPGEPLEVLDEVLFEDDQGSQTWLMIAPPAGEFRWVAAADVRRPGEPEADPSPAPHDAEPVAYQDESVEPRLAPPVQREWTSAKRPLAPSSLAASEDLSKTIRDELDALEMELSAMVADDPQAWHVEPLRQRLDNLLLLQHTPADARRALGISRRLDRFAALGRRAQTVTRPVVVPSTPAHFATPAYPVTSQSAWTPPRPAAAPQGTAPQGIGPQWIAPHPGQVPVGGWPVAAAAPWQSPGPAFDASGLLRPVILPGQPGSPSYAIVDAQGRPLSYVSTSPGIDLRPYVGHAVGLNGPRGFDLQRGAPLVRADRVTLLDAPVRR